MNCWMLRRGNENGPDGCVETAGHSEIEGRGYNIVKTSRGRG